MTFPAALLKNAPAEMAAHQLSHEARLDGFFFSLMLALRKLIIIMIIIIISQLIILISLYNIDFLLLLFPPITPVKT